MAFKKLINSSLASFGKAIGYDIQVTKVPKPNEHLVNLNVGSGGYSIPRFVDLDVSSDWYSSTRGQEFVEYDMRRCDIPFQDNSVDNIYCSHVFEHIEDVHVSKFIAESARVLKQGGCLRVTCPDAEFLWSVSQFENEYWNWRHDWFRSRAIDPKNCSQFDFLTREICTEKLRVFRESKLEKEFDFREFADHLEAFETLSEGATFDAEKIGNHINHWDFAKLRGAAAGLFSNVVRSKFQGCVSKVMTGCLFDKTAPQMPLYVDLVK